MITIGHAATPRASGEQSITCQDRPTKREGEPGTSDRKLLSAPFPQSLSDSQLLRLEPVSSGPGIWDAVLLYPSLIDPERIREVADAIVDGVKNGWLEPASGDPLIERELAAPGSSRPPDEREDRQDKLATSRSFSTRRGSQVGRERRRRQAIPPRSASAASAQAWPAQAPSETATLSSSSSGSV